MDVATNPSLKSRPLRLIKMNLAPLSSCLIRPQGSSVRLLFLAERAVRAVYDTPPPKQLSKAAILNKFVGSHPQALLIRARHPVDWNVLETYHPAVARSLQDSA